MFYALIFIVLVKCGTCLHALCFCYVNKISVFFDVMMFVSIFYPLNIK